MIARGAPGRKPARWMVLLDPVFLRRLATHVLIFTSFIAVWEWAGQTGRLNDLIMPAPSAIAAAIWRMYVVTGEIYWHFFVTMFEAVSGFVIGGVIGLGLAIGAALSLTFRRYVAPYAVALNVTPGIAVTPIFIAWFGFGWNSKIALAALIVFFPIFVNSLSGLLRVDRDTEELMRSLGASKMQTFFKLMLPNAAPMIFAGFKVAITTALVGAIVAEFASATEGIGIMMQRYAHRLDIAASIGVLISMALMGLLLFTLMEVADRRTVFWLRPERLEQVSRKRRRRLMALK
ncbi:ABC transporter permease [Histidinibacterium lentulum]|uniref:ABC transporter permease n=1 Tax=Histidinibacterium lentulum TaxID=2480588 RepID=A0A3N2QS43_9RHOB|nr:ABC transporter permease [Histidinibacterium lentulum]ROT97815.1 ABC transporter permease [Histidinibacterium lentulum]